MIVPSAGRGTSRRGVPPVAGLVLLDRSLRPIYYNAEARRILTYSGRSRRLRSLESLLPKGILSTLANWLPNDGATFPVEFTSGKRHYLCRAFPLIASSRRASQAVFGILIERSLPKPPDFSKTVGKFRLTPRERESVELLMLGLTNKEIAIRMRVSPNTVKTFLRLTMSKMGVSTRTGVFGKIVRSQAT